MACALVLLSDAPAVPPSTLFVAVSERLDDAETLIRPPPPPPPPWAHVSGLSDPGKRSAPLPPLVLNPPLRLRLDPSSQMPPPDPPPPEAAPQVGSAVPVRPFCPSIRIAPETSIVDALRCTDAPPAPPAPPIPVNTSP